jgi:hypothetical protein
MPYNKFTAELARISSQNFKAVRGAEIAEWGDVPEGSVVLPCDDDDWFSPLAASIVFKAMSNEAELALWTQSVLEVPITFLHSTKLFLRGLLPFVKPAWTCSTNNYAVRKSARNYPAFMSHVRASRLFDGNRLLVKLNGRLSLQNRSLASQTSVAGHGIDHLIESGDKLKLKITNTRIDVANVGCPRHVPKNSHRLVRRLEAYKNLYTRYQTESGSELAWSRPYVDAVRNLTLALKTW